MKILFLYCSFATVSAYEKLIPIMHSVNNINIL